MRARPGGALLLAAVALGAVLASCGGGAERAPPRAARAASSPQGEVASNITFADYAGTAACAPCHEDRVREWLASPMRNMTRDAEGARVRGPFDGAVFRMKGDVARLETSGGARFMTLETARGAPEIYRVTRVIGGHHREDYAGVRVARKDAGIVPGPGAEERVLPVSFVFATNALRYKGYSVMVKERPGLRVGPVWSETCIFCHNTPPHLSTILGALAAPGARPYQGEFVDRLLPPERRARLVVTDASALGSALESELDRIGASSRSPTVAQAIEATRGSFRREHLVEVGIGCEACHLGSAEHVRDPGVRPSFEPRSEFIDVTWPKLGGPAGAALDGAELRAARINRVCAKCHQVLFSGYEPTWEGGRRHGRAGGSHINSGEARDMLLGACASKLSCVECHDPHAKDGTARLRALDAASSDALCTRCHDRYASREELRAHAHHDPSGEGARCVSCHMPRKNLSLDGDLTRYHRIGSPTDPARVLLDRPLECATCHGDASVESLVSTMERWWNKVYDRPALERLYGDLAARPLVATAERGHPHEQAVAFFVLGERRDRAAVPVLASQLTHPYPLVRGYAKRALDAIYGAPVPVDIDAEREAIEEATKTWLARGAAP